MRKYIHTYTSLRTRRRELRKNSTPQEIILWQYLKARQLGFKFQRQHSIGQYIVDFYCAKKRLVIELDGSQHLDNQEYDKERTDYLENTGYRVLRFWNGEVDTNLPAVISIIQQNLKYF